MKTTLRTTPFTTRDGEPSKAILIERDGGETITIRLGVQEARQLAAALKPSGRDITLSGDVR